jgi:CRISPR-associated protein Cmr6
MDILAKSLQQCRNLGLWLDKFRSINEERDDKGELWENLEDQWKLSETAKRREGFALRLSAPVPSLLKSANARRSTMFSALRSRGTTVIEFTAEPDYRLILGFGTEHVLETNLYLHRIYGFPILPGSAVKGVTRARAFWEIAENLGVPVVSAVEAQQRKVAKSKTPLQLLDQLLVAGDPESQQKTLTQLQQDSLCTDLRSVQMLDLAKWLAQTTGFCQVFGTTKRRGQVIFFDAYPTQTPKLVLDVLNPHYGKYYRDEAPPADYLDPIPTYFLTVAKDSAFQFALVSESPGLANKAKQWLTDALTDLGIGGKTSAGYGFMPVKS